MKNILSLLIFTLSIFQSIAQIRAVTSNGDEVILYSNGTWEYADKDAERENKIDTNSSKFSKDQSASFLVKSNKTNFGVYINSKKWSFQKSKEDEVSEFEFTLKGKDAYAMLITEKIEIPLQSLRSIAVENAKDAAPDIKVVQEEYRWVNDNLILNLQMEGSIQGVKFTYFGYYFSSSAGTVQFLSYTSTNLFREYQKEFQEFLNGFVIVK